MEYDALFKMSDDYLFKRALEIFDSDEWESVNEKYIIIIEIDLKRLDKDVNG